MIILGIDHGQRKIGLAVSDETELIAAPLPVLLVKNYTEAVEGIKMVVENLKVGKIVLGLPTGWEGKDSPRTTEVRTFKQKLQKHVKLEIDFWDESFSSKRAEKGARKRKRANSDSEAARIILQEYLDYQRERTSSASSST